MKRRPSQILFLDQHHPGRSFQRKLSRYLSGCRVHPASAEAGEGAVAITGRLKMIDYERSVAFKSHS